MSGYSMIPSEHQLQTINYDMPNYARDIHALQSHAVMWWPEDLKNENATISIIPKLLETQDDFISILKLSKNSPTQVFELVEAADFPANLFLKHLVVISDYGGELIQRLGENFTEIFTKKDPTGKPIMDYIWKQINYQYVFESMPVKISNKKLKIDGKGLQSKQPFDSLKRDMTMILLYASTSEVSELAGLEVCLIGSLLGDAAALDRHIKQRYIVFSRITGGESANSLGQLAESYILKYLKAKLGSEFDITSKSSIILPGNNQSGKTFDIVVAKGGKKVGIEVSFQVTTNSTIVRKSQQAKDRKERMNRAGHKIAYVIDGAGNFQRSSAISEICQYSDCTVAYSNSEFDVLADFLHQSLP
jgi:hypothetical protein